MDALTWLIVAFVFGLLFYYADQKNLGMYRGWYNFWHKEKLASSQGFVYQQPFVTRLWFAGILSFVKAVLFALWGVQHILHETLLIIPTVVGLMFSFYLFGGVAKIWSNKQKIIDKLDLKSNQAVPPITTELPPLQEKKDEVPLPPVKDVRERLRERGLLGDKNNKS